MAAKLCAITVLCILLGITSAQAETLVPYERGGFTIALPPGWQVLNDRMLEQDGGSILLLAGDEAGGLKLSVVAAANGSVLQDEFGELDAAGLAGMCRGFGEAMTRLGKQESCERVESRNAFALRMSFAVPDKGGPMRNLMLLFPDKPRNMVISALFPETGSAHYLPLMEKVMGEALLPPPLP